MTFTPLTRNSPAFVQTLCLLAVCSLASTSSAALPAAERSLANPPSQEPTAQDEELSDKLIRQALGEGEGGIMDEVSALMKQSEKQLGIGFDPGQATQSVQRRIIDKLDDAIASAQRRKSKSSSSKRQTSDRRKRSTKPKEKQQAGKTQKAQDSSKSNAKGSVTDTGETKSGRFREARRGWGMLPERDRDEVLQGAEESVIEKYRELVERYFRALANDDQE